MVNYEDGREEEALNTQSRRPEIEPPPLTMGLVGFRRACLGRRRPDVCTEKLRQLARRKTRSLIKIRICPDREIRHGTNRTLNYCRATEFLRTAFLPPVKPEPAAPTHDKILMKTLHGLTAYRVTMTPKSSVSVRSARSAPISLR